MCKLSLAYEGGGMAFHVTFVIGPAEDNGVRCSVDVGLGFDLNAVIVWLTPSANMNCSRSSIFVLPLATVCRRARSSVSLILFIG